MSTGKESGVGNMDALNTFQCKGANFGQPMNDGSKFYRGCSRDTIWNQDLLWKVRLVNEFMEEKRRVENFDKLQKEYEQIRTNNFKRINVEKMREVARQNRNAKRQADEVRQRKAEQSRRRHDPPPKGTVAGHLHSVTQRQKKLREGVRANPRE